MDLKYQLLAVLSLLLAIIACDEVTPPRYGCTNEFAINYDSTATLDDGTCEFDTTDSAIVLGCTDPLATNYDSLAVIDNGTCEYDTTVQSDTVRHVLLEDYTGFRCSNCPEAAEELKRLMSVYGSRVIPLAVHVTQTFAAPENNPDGSFSTDFRTEIGDIYEIEFGTGLFLPNGTVNRKEFQFGSSLLFNQWEDRVAEVLTEAPEAHLDLDISYNPGSRQVTAEMKVTALTDLDADPYRYVFLLSEDSIIDWQSDNRVVPPKIPDYVHMHTLRAGFNGPWGTSLNGGDAMQEGFTETVSKSLVIDAEFVDHNCNVVAFIFRDDTKEVIQADYKPVIKE